MQLLMGRRCSWRRQPLLSWQDRRCSACYCWHQLIAGAAHNKLRILTLKLSWTGLTTCKGNMLNTVSTPVKGSDYAKEKPRLGGMM